jgi:RHS repeat-associated protein
LRHADTGTTLPTSGTAALYYHRNQQYSIVGLSDAAGALVERYAYTAYGELTILAPDRTLRATSSFQNRYTYTGREWDPTLRLYYFRARWLEPKAGRFIGRDPLGYVDGMGLYGAYFVIRGVDPFGLKCDDQECQKRAKRLEKMGAVCCQGKLWVPKWKAGGQKADPYDYDPAGEGIGHYQAVRYWHWRDPKTGQFNWDPEYGKEPFAMGLILDVRRNYVGLGAFREWVVSTDRNAEDWSDRVSSVVQANFKCECSSESRVRINATITHPKKDESKGLYFNYFAKTEMQEERGGTPDIVKILHKAEVGIRFSNPISPGLAWGFFSGQLNVPEVGWSISENGWQEYECVERP